MAPSPVVTHKSYPFSIAVKAIETDKVKMSQSLKERHDKEVHEILEAEDTRETVETLEPLKYADESTDDWIKYEKPLSYFYAGKGPYVSR